MLLCIPSYFAFKPQADITDQNTTNVYLTRTHFGESTGFEIFWLICTFLESLGPLILLFILNTISLIKFKLVLRRWKGRRDGSSLNKMKISMTKLTILLTFICLLTRSFDFVISYLVREKINLNEVWRHYGSFEEHLLFLLQSINLFLLFAAHALDVLFYFFYDTHLKTVTLKMMLL